MAANVSFTIKVLVTNAGVLPELQARMADLEPAFHEIYSEWVEINEQKFELSVGKELTGADVFGEFWAPLSPGYMKEKHKTGTAKVTKKTARGGKASYGGPFPDWLLVRTGALRAAMINPDALFQYFDAQQAIFGTPLDPDLADIVIWQTGARQKERYVVFLSDPDVNAIRRILQDYFSLGGDFKEMRFAEGLAAVRLEDEVTNMDAEFNVDAGGEV